MLEATNVAGSKRVFQAAARSGARALVYASSIGAYSPGPKDTRVDESWPTEGIGTSFYSRHKVATERLLEHFEAEHPSVRVVRLRPALIFKREAASGIRRLFLGRPVPPRLLRPSLIPGRAHLQPTPPGWVDLAVGVPIMDTTRARRELGWRPTRTSGQALCELLEGFADRAFGPTPALASDGWRAPAVTAVTPQVPAP